jgi:hypothetical protein
MKQAELVRAAGIGDGESSAISDQSSKIIAFKQKIPVQFFWLGLETAC